VSSQTDPPSLQQHIHPSDNPEIIQNFLLIFFEI
jgi:hypothetical protein